MRFSAVVAFVAYYIALKYNCSYHWNYYSHCHCYSGCSCSYSAHARTYYNHYMTLTAQYIAWRYCNRIHYITQIKSHYWAALQIRLHYTSIIRTHNHLHTWTCAWTHVKKRTLFFSYTCTFTKKMLILRISQTSKFKLMCARMFWCIVGTSTYSAHEPQII